MLCANKGDHKQNYAYADLSTALVHDNLPMESFYFIIMMGIDYKQMESLHEQLLK